MKRLFFCFVLFSFFVGCASTTQLRYVEKNLKPIYVDGKKYLSSEKKNSIVTLSFHDLVVKSGNRVYVTLYFQNLGDQSYVVNPETIYMIRKSKKDRFYTISYSELIDEVDSQRRTYTVFAFLGAIAQGLSSGRTNYKGNITTSRGRSYSYRGSSYNSTLAEIENEKYSRDVSRNLKQFFVRKQHLREMILKKNTLLSRESVSGSVVLDWPELESYSDYFLIVINFAGDRHKFYVQQKLVR